MSEQERRETDQRDAKSVRSILWVGALILLLWGIWSIQACCAVTDARKTTVPGDHTSVEEKRLAQLGQAGDAFGPISALAASLGFMGVAYTIYRQHLDAEAAERRRSEERESDKKRAEAAGVRHQQIVAAEEKVAMIGALTTAINHSGAELVIWERKMERLSTEGHRIVNLACTLPGNWEVSELKGSEKGRALIEGYLQIFDEEQFPSKRVEEIRDQLLKWRDGEYTHLNDKIRILKDREAIALAELNRLAGSILPEFPADWNGRWRTDSKPLKWGG
jgi:hypothetical protein